MSEYLYRCTIEYAWHEHGNKWPVYAVAKSKEEAKAYVEKYLTIGKVKSVSCLGKRLSMNLYHGRRNA